MFCDHCGSQISDSSKFCDKCGKATTHAHIAFLSWLVGKFNLKRFAILSHEKKRNLLLLTCIIIFLGLSWVGYTVYSRNQKNLYNTIQKQSIQTAQLENQIKEVQQQNASTTQALASELNSQKLVAADAEQQAQSAQQQLAIAKQQAQSQTNGFPNINTKAIVRVLCTDNSGSWQSGSGTIVDSQGYVLTNRHVVTDTNGDVLQCWAIMNNGGSSPQIDDSIAYTLNDYAPSSKIYSNYDAAILKITGATYLSDNTQAPLPSSFPFIKPNGGNLSQGETIYIFGYPAASSFVFNATKGIVSSLTADGTFINTDAVIDEGNSGGAAITSDGRFVGIPTQKYIADSDYLGQILRVENLAVPN